MNKATKSYLIFWAIILAAFNTVVFVVPGWDGADKYTGAFWTGYIFTTIAMVIHLVVTLGVLKESDGSSWKLFYNIPIIYLSYTFMVVSIVVGSLCMLNSNMSVWIGVTVSVLLTVFYAGAILKTKIATEAIEAVDARVETQTTFIRDITSQVSGLKSYAKSEISKDMCNKVYEALRFSDPMSRADLNDLETQIKATVNEFTSAVKNNDEETISDLGNKAIELIGQRKSMCKAGKHESKV